MFRSIRKQFATIFIVTTVITILVCYCLNTLFLEDFYLQKKQNNILSVYEELNSAAKSNAMSEENFKDEIQRMSGKYDISIMVLDSHNRVVLSILTNERDVIHLMDYVYGFGDINKNEIIKSTSKYTIQRATDIRMQTDFLEIWGVLDNGYAFLERVALESVSESASVANTFLLYTGIGIALISAFVIWFIVGKMTKPVYTLTEISRKMADLDFGEKYHGKSQNEIGLLGNHINRLSIVLENTISELKTANNKLTKDIAQKEEIDKMRKEFLDNVSHELKTPIALIQGYAEGLKEGINEDKESCDYYCEVIIDEANKMNELVKKLLNLNQLEAGADSAVMEHFNITELIANYLQAAEIILTQNNVALSINTDEDIYVWADEFRIEEVFNNYFTNAINHLDENRKIDIKIIKTDNKVRVSVFNTGKNIPEESLPYIWDKFYKADKARTREYGGSGVGLSIVKAIMESLNQQYGVINYANGVEFWFEVDSQ